MKRIYFISLAATAILLAVFGINRLGLTSPTRATPQTVSAASAVDVDEVGAIKVGAIQRDGTAARVLVTNVSPGEEVSALMILIDDGSTIMVDYTLTDDGISPGASKELRVPTDPTSESLFASEKVTPFFKIAAVVFTNHTSEGNPQFIAEIYERRQGIKSQLEKFLASFEKMSVNTETKMRTGLQSLGESIQAQPAVNAKDSHFFRLGFREGKDDLLEFIKQIEQSQQRQANFQDTHAKFVEGIGKMRARLSRL